jgi:hypothetical protein
MESLVDVYPCMATIAACTHSIWRRDAHPPDMVGFVRIAKSILVPALDSLPIIKAGRSQLPGFSALLLPLERHVRGFLAIERCCYFRPDTVGLQLTRSLDGLFMHMNRFQPFDIHQRGCYFLHSSMSVDQRRD